MQNDISKLSGKATIFNGILSFENGRVVDLGLVLTILKGIVDTRANSHSEPEVMGQALERVMLMAQHGLTHVEQGIGSHAISADDLSTVLRCAQQHVEDIESGLRDGDYEAEENKDLPDKQAALKRLDAWQEFMSSGRPATLQPNRYLVVLDKGGIMEEYFQQGNCWKTEVELLDCQNGIAGDLFIFTKDWKPLLTQVFHDQIPTYVQFED